MRIAKIGFMPSSRMAMFGVFMTGNPDAVLQLLLTARFGALLFDNWMPKINGTELYRMIRFHDQNCRFSSVPAQSQRAIKRSRLKPVRKAIL